MAPRSVSRGSAKKTSARSKKSKPSTSDPSLVPSSPFSEEETEGTPIAEDQVLEVETHDSVAKDDVVGGDDHTPSDTAEEKNTVSMEETESESVTAVEVVEIKGVEGLEKEPDVKEITSNESDGVKLENAEESKVCLSEELESDKVSLEQEVLLVPLSEDAVPSGTGDIMNVDEGLKQNVGDEIGKDDKEIVPDISSNVIDCVQGVYVNHDSTNYTNEENEENEESDQDLYLQAMLMEGKERKESEIFVGGLDKGVVEDDLVKVFKAFGEIQSVRIVKRPTTKKCKGFAFIAFSSDDLAMKALTDKEGIEVNGKRVRVQASHDNATLFLENISKAWTRDNVIETLKIFGVDQTESLILPEDLMIKGKIKGFAFLEFSSNSDAMTAFQRLRNPDVFFGRETAVKVSFVRAPLHPSQEEFLQVKTVCIEGIPLSWDEEKIREIFKEYGQIERVIFSRNFSSSKRKDIGFLKFSSHESAVASVDGINNAQLGDGDANIKASLSKPLNKGQHTKQEEIQLKQKNVIETVQSESENKNGGPDSQIAKSVKRKNGSGNPTEGARRGSSKKMKMHHNHDDGKAYGQHSSRARNKKSSYPKNPQKISYPARHQRRTNSEYYAYTAASEPQLRHSDLEPHAGYLPAAERVSTTYEYDRRRFEAYNNEQRRIPDFSRAMQRQPTSYQEYTRYADHQPFGYGYARTGAYAPRGPYY